MSYFHGPKKIEEGCKDKIRNNVDRGKLSNIKGFKNLYTPNKIKDVSTSTRDVIVSNLMEKVKDTYSTSVFDLLKKEIPKIPGGITCEELVKFIEPSYSGYKSKIVRYSIEFIQKPANKECIAELSDETGVYFTTNEIIKMLGN